MNRNFSTASLEWGYNCQRCVVAYEMRQRGYDVVAKSRPTKIEKSFLFGKEMKVLAPDHLSSSPFDAWNPPESIACPGGMAEIEHFMEKWGDGSRSEVMVLWKNGHGRGHVFVAQQISGQTHFIDPQSGETGVEYYFDLAETDSICICRMDDKQPSELIGECCS